MRRFLLYVFFISAIGICGCVSETSNSESVINHDTINKEDITNLRSELSQLRKDMKIMTAKLDSLKSAMAKENTGNNNRKPKADTTVYGITTENSPILGPKDTAVTIAMFMDFQCPYCISEDSKIKDILKEYPDKVRLVFKHYPLAFHKKAKPAHAAVQLAYIEKGQKGFWAMYNMILANPRKLDVPVLRGYAEQLGLDMATFDKTLADEKTIDKLLSDDKEEAKKCKVGGTPTVLINGLKMESRTMGAYRERINELLAAS